MLILQSVLRLEDFNQLSLWVFYPIRTLSLCTGRPCLALSLGRVLLSWGAARLLSVEFRASSPSSGPGPGS